MRQLGTLSLWAVVAASALAATACSGGGSGGGSGGTTVTPPATENGEVTVAVTDAASDEIDVFEVDLVSFRFLRRDGATVEVLPQRTRIDFAQLVTVSEVIAAATLPVGDYTRAFMTVDFAAAQVRITGNTQAAALVDRQGNALNGREELEIVFPNGGFTCGARRGYFAEVDFDLDQSLAVDAAANRVTVDSVLYATIDPAQPKEARLPGLASAFAGAGFELDVRLGLGLVTRGRLSVTTDSTTAFGIDGQVLVGQAGFDALAARGDSTLVLTHGIVDPARRTLAAKKVLLLPQGLDEVGGMVVARSGGPGQDATLTLRGVSVRRAQGSVTFNDTVTLRTARATTKVGRRNLPPGSLDTDAINVGQRILAYGTFAGATLDLTQTGAGFVHLVETDLAGAVSAPPAGGALELATTRIGRHQPAAFDFRVEGVAQADPQRLVCDTGALGLATVTSGSAVVMRGFFAPVTSATPTGAPFKADTVIDRSDAASLLHAVWLPASSAPIASSSATDLALNLSGTVVAQVDRGLVAPTSLTGTPTLVGPSGSGYYALRRGTQLTLFTTFSAWKAALEAELAAGGRLSTLKAVGRYEAGPNRITAQRACAFLF